MRIPATVFLLLLLLVSCAQETTQTTSTAPVAPAPAPEPPRTITCTPAAHRLCPVDEGQRDASFAAYRESMKEAVSRKDAAQLLAMIDPAIRTDFGGGGGADDFKSHWDLSSPDSRLWPELAQILELGGIRREESFWAPYIYAAWPEEVDAFEHVAAVKAGVPIRTEPSETASAVTSVDWEILRVLPEKSEGWMRVKTSAGQEGWVATTDVRSPVGYRAGFSKRTGEWKMEALVAGD